MTERSEDLREALRECADLGVPDDAADPWPLLRERAGERLAGRKAPGHRGMRRRLRFVPRTRAGWALATLAALLVLSTGAYATGGIVDVLDYVFGGTVPYVQEHELGTPVGKEISRDGVTVTVDRVYADSYYVVVGFHVDGLDRLGDEPGNPNDDLFADVKLSDPTAGAGKAFAMSDGYWAGWAPGRFPPSVPKPPRGSQVGTVVFQSPTELERGERRFRVEVGLFRGASQTPVVAPFVFDLESPVEPAPTIQVNQTVERNGVPITLTRVVNSPVSTYAFLCFDPPEGKYDWPAVETGFMGLGGGHLADVPVNHPTDVGGAAREGCATYNFGKTLYDQPGRHSLTITKLVADDPGVGGYVKGPWRFHFEVPRP